MKTLNDVTCKCCGNTTSCMWADPEEVARAHVCPDGQRSDQIAISTRVVPGHGERGRDREGP